jgi:threonine dehydrogenase-like Zn-dependent dehydrogenase
VKAVVVVPGGVELQDVPDPRPEPGSVVVRVHSAAICGSDVHGVESGRAPAGLIMGHELSGTVAATGYGVAGLPEGTAVAVNPLGSCGECAACEDDLPFLCSIPNVGLGAPGGFAEYTAVPARQLHPLPDGVDVELGARAEPLAVALRAVALADFTPGDDALVFGVGSIGLNVILALRALGAGTVVAIGRSLPRRAAAARAGADVVLDSGRTSVVDYAAEHGLRFPHVFECSGAPDAIATVLPTVAVRGTVVEVALAGPAEVDLRALVAGQRKVVGSCAFGDNEYLTALDLILHMGVDVATVISNRITLAEAPHMLTHMRGVVGVVVQPWR